MLKQIKELTPTQSIKMVKSLLKNKESLSRKNFQPGRLLMYHYDAKDKDQTYDRTPLVLILRTGKIHTLGLNFHWLPVSMRVSLIKHILKVNKHNIAKGSELQFTYTDFKPMLRKYGYAPCIRLYINNRISPKGTVIPPENLVEVARLKSETFTRGKYSAEQLYKKATSQAKKSSKLFRKRKKKK